MCFWLLKRALNEERSRIAEFLLREKYYLTALEFHQELLEALDGCHNVQELNDFFSNPQNFPIDLDVPDLGFVQPISISGMEIFKHIKTINLKMA